MKKLAFVFAAIVAVSFASCGNKAANNQAENADSVAVEVVEVVEACDSMCADSTKACCGDSTACQGDSCTHVAE